MTEFHRWFRLPFLLVAVWLVVLALGCCCGWGSKFERAQRAAEKGSYDEAITLYEEALEEDPDGENAWLIPGAIEVAMFNKAVALLEEGKYVEAGQATLDLFEYAPEWMEKISETETGKDLLCAAGFAEQSETMSDGSLGIIMNAWRLSSPGLQEAIGDWVCTHRTKFPEYAACGDINPDIDGLSALEAQKRLEAAEAACGAIWELTEVCDAKVDEEIDALVTSKALADLGRASDAAWRRHQRDIQKEFDGHRRTIKEFARTCEDTKRENRKIIQDGMRVNRSEAERYWELWQFNIQDATAPIPEMIVGYKLQFATDTNTMKDALTSDLFSAECNEAIEAGYQRMQLDCIQEGSPVDLSWIDDWCREECP